MNVTEATVDDAARLLELRESLSSWLIGRGIHQWLPKSLGIESLEREINEGSVFVAHDGGELVGSLTIVREDERIWGQTPGDADYVHRLMVDRRWSGHGVGSDLLAWARRRAEVSGRHWLRLDCAENNSALRAYYEKVGFRCVGLRDIAGLLPDGGAVALFEMSLTPTG